MSYGALDINRGPFLRSMLPPYTMPGGWSMTRGGINLPAAASTVPSLLWTGMGPQTGAYAGMDAGYLGAGYEGAKRRKRYRDVVGRGGYVYRQYQDGSITILSGPALVGTTMTATSDPRRWQAITQEIGTFVRAPSAFTQNLPEILRAVTSVAQTASTALVPAAAAAEIDDFEEPIPEAAPNPLMSALPWIGGGLLLAAVVGVALSRR